MRNLLLSTGLFTYQLKPAEIIWAVLQGAAAFIVATTTAPVSYDDWQSWAIALGAAAARPAIAVIFGKAPA